MLKKLIALLLAATMVLPMGAMAWAEENGNDTCSLDHESLKENVENISAESEKTDETTVTNENAANSKSIKGLNPANKNAHTAADSGLTTDYTIYFEDIGTPVEIIITWTSDEVNNLSINYNENITPDCTNYDEDNKTATVELTSKTAFLSDFTISAVDEEDNELDSVTVEVLFTENYQGYYECGGDAFLLIDQTDDYDWDGYVVGDGDMYNYSDYTNVPWYSNRSYFENLTFGSGITSVGKNCFYNCVYITSLDFSDNMEALNYGAFMGCIRLSEVYIPKSLTYIDPFAFSLCYSLEDVTVSSQNTAYVESEGVLYNEGKQTLVLYPAALSDNNTFVIPDTVTRIYDGAFFGCQKLINIVIPQTVKYIGYYAFAYSEIDKIIFCGTAPEFNGEKAWIDSCLDIYYPDNDSTWNDLVENNEQYGGTVNWIKCAVKCSGLTVSASTIDKQYELEAYATYGKLYYTSNNSAVKVSDKGIVTVSANYAGSATITITAGGDNYKVTSKQVKITIKRISNSVDFMFGTKTLTTSVMEREYNNKASASGVPISYSSDNSKLKVSSSGTVTIPANYIGSATICATANTYGIYNYASNSYVITVNPSMATLSSVSKIKNSKAVGIKMEAKEGRGGVSYQFQISDNSKFSKNVRNYSGSARTRSVKAAKNKTWYVRVRYYKKSKKGTKTATFYGNWSATKKIKL